MRMQVLKRIFDFYLEGSVQVALSVFALIQVTAIRLELPFDMAVSGFGFFGTVVGYNFVKYDAIARNGKPHLSAKIKAFAVLSFLSFLGAAFFFLQLERITQVVSVAVLGITALYTLPFFPNRKTARDWAGFKIYFVAISWVGVTVALPVLDAGAEATPDFYVTCVQRFILVIVLLFIFEIIDLAWDDPHLRTVPQQIGVKRTKWLGFILMLVLLLLEWLKQHNNEAIFWCNTIFGVAISLFLLFAKETRGRYYTLFWVEGLTVLWWLALAFTIDGVLFARL